MVCAAACRRGSGGVLVGLEWGRWGEVIVLNDSCETGATIAGVGVVVTQSQAVDGEDRLPDC